MDKEKFLQDLSLVLEDDLLLVKYQDKTLGKIPIDWSSLKGQGEQGGGPPVQKEKKPPTKQYVEGCDLGWC